MQQKFIIYSKYKFILMFKRAASVRAKTESVFEADCFDACTMVCDWPNYIIQEVAHHVAYKW